MNDSTTNTTDTSTDTAATVNAGAAATVNAPGEMCICTRCDTEQLRANIARHHRTKTCKQVYARKQANDRVSHLCDEIEKLKGEIKKLHQEKGELKDYWLKEGYWQAKKDFDMFQNIKKKQEELECGASHVDDRYDLRAEKSILLNALTPINS